MLIWTASATASAPQDSTSFVGDIDVNAQLVEAGWAWHFTKYNCEERFTELQAAAQDSKRGLWAHDHPIAPWEYRKLQKERAAAKEAQEEREWQEAKKWALENPQLSPKPKPAKPKPAPPRILQTVPRAAPGGAYWLNTSTGVRHNATCQHFGKTKRGRQCGGGEGKACGFCGG